MALLRAFLPFLAGVLAVVIAVPVLNPIAGEGKQIYSEPTGAIILLVLFAAVWLLVFAVIRRR